MSRIGDAACYLLEHPERLEEILSRIENRNSTDSCWIWTGAMSANVNTCTPVVSIQRKIVSVREVLLCYSSQGRLKKSHLWCQTLPCVNPWHADGTHSIGLVRARRDIILRTFPSSVKVCYLNHPIIGPNACLTGVMSRKTGRELVRCRICHYTSQEKNKGRSYDRAIVRIQQALQDFTYES